MFTLYVEDVALNLDQLDQFAKRNKVEYVVVGHDKVYDWYQVTFSADTAKALYDVAYVFFLDVSEIK